MRRAVETSGGRAITGTILTRLQASAPADMHELLPHLQARGEQYARDAETKLLERGEAEAKAMREILETQRRHIAETAARLDNYDSKQTRLDFGDQEDELRQLNDNRNFRDTSPSIGM